MSPTCVLSTSSAHNYGRLDDGEFEGFARALCVADQLEDDPDDPEPTTFTEPRISWVDFKEHVDGLLAPKKLLGVTKSHPDSLRIRTPDGHTHPVGDLSSGERQALFIVSRLLRAGSGHSVVIIDEPDAYLHPDLSRRLATLLGELVGEGSQLIFATHSTAILDAIPATKIVRLSHSSGPRLVTDEAERLEVYRSVGFRVSALTQSDLLLIPEGTTDEQILPLLVPELVGSSLRSAGGRTPVLKGVAALRPYDLPVLGVIDADVLADDVPADIADRVVVWGVSDLEAVFLSDDASLDVLVNRNLVQEGFNSVAALRAQLDALVLAQRDHFVAEAAQRLLRRALNWKFPSPKAADPIRRLREAASTMRAPDTSAVEQAVTQATTLWTEHETAKTLWEAVRGKYVIREFTQRCTTVTSADALLRAVAAAGPDLVVWCRSS